MEAMWAVMATMMIARSAREEVGCMNIDKQNICDITGSVCGTDAWEAGNLCMCLPCQETMMNEMEWMRELLMRVAESPVAAERKGVEVFIFLKAELWEQIQEYRR